MLRDLLTEVSKCTLGTALGVASRDLCSVVAGLPSCQWTKTIWKNHCTFTIVPWVQNGSQNIPSWYRMYSSLPSVINIAYADPPVHLVCTVLQPQAGGPFPSRKGITTGSGAQSGHLKQFNWFVAHILAAIRHPSHLQGHSKYMRMVPYGSRHLVTSVWRSPAITLEHVVKKTIQLRFRWTCFGCNPFHPFPTFGWHLVERCWSLVTMTSDRRFQMRFRE